MAGYPANKGIGSDRALARYAQEGVLRRMKAAFGDRVVLKGTLLFLIENGNEHRPTTDADVHFHDKAGRRHRSHQGGPRR
jgi:hypothetical protein